ncbi:MAG: hypothetical protein LCH41_13550 [Armatimonadetes bacterium]|nr:hypothetical protein [Armatimonadota bacterium]
MSEKHPIEWPEELESAFADASITPEVDDSFNDILMSRLTAQKLKNTLWYWSPALVAAAATILGLLTLLQMQKPETTKSFTPGQSEARLESQSQPELPRFQEQPKIR